MTGEKLQGPTQALQPAKPFLFGMYPGPPIMLVPFPKLKVLPISI